MQMTLIDGVARNTENPDTFCIPNEEEKDMVKEGMLCKLGFETPDCGECGGERMWVVVTNKTEGGFVGTLRNEPVFLDLEFGDEVHFQRKNIIDIAFDDEESE
jgi:uncharacterized protein YegJ (DUF2314 family)